MNFFRIFLFSLIFLLLLPFPVKASEVNKFGIHILEANEVSQAADLVNSAGGDWGWVTIVIRDNDLNFQKWQDFMDQCREKHLVPLIRLATHPEGNFWAKPKIEDIPKWIEFLNQLNWPVKDRFLIIFNEPNQSQEWGGEINPKEYAQILNSFAQEFKKINNNFKILNAGFDLAAPNSKTTMDVFLFWQKMNQEVPGIFEILDGWVSHSYPNHGFRGKPTDKGRITVSGYQWEIATLKRYFGLKKDLPVFITETGWPQKSKQNPSFYPPETTAEYLKLTFQNLWLKDPKVMAITPFVLKYPQSPFTEFSWIDASGSFSLQYQVIKNLPKISWWPSQEEKYILGEIMIPPFMLTQSSFKGKVLIKNTGQSILGERETFLLKSEVSSPLITVSPLQLNKKIKPFAEGFLEFELITGTSSGTVVIAWENTPQFEIKIFQPSLIKKVEYSFWEKIILKIKNFLLKLKKANVA